MVFDYDAYLASLEPPTFRTGDQTIRGRILSIEDWVRFQDGFQRIQRGDMDYPAWKVFARSLCDAWFPAPRRSVLQQIRDFVLGRRSRSVADLVLDLPLPGQHEAIRGFCESQASAMGTAVRTPGTETPNRSDDPQPDT